MIQAEFYGVAVIQKWYLHSSLNTLIQWNLLFIFEVCFCTISSHQSALSGILNKVFWPSIAEHFYFWVLTIFWWDDHLFFLPFPHDYIYEFHLSHACRNLVRSSVSIGTNWQPKLERKSCMHYCSIRSCSLFRATLQNKRSR